MKPTFTSTSSLSLNQACLASLNKEFSISLFKRIYKKLVIIIYYFENNIKFFKNFRTFPINHTCQCRSANLATTGLPVIFVKVQKAWNLKTPDCLRTCLPAVSGVKWKVFLNFNLKVTRKKSFRH